MMTHHSVMTSSLRIKILKIDKFGDFSYDIDYNSKTDVFRDVISDIISKIKSLNTSVLLTKFRILNPDGACTCTPHQDLIYEII